MSDPIRSFGNVATGLARNPLGIIALFIVLVYGFASLVTAFGQNFTAGEKVPLIYFMVFFPVLVLAVFAWLVSRHSSDLFGPDDFKDQADYVKLQEMKRAKLNELDRALGREAASLVDAAVAHPGSISSEQIQSASKIEVGARSFGSDIVEIQLSQLSAEYENVRNVMPPSPARTRAMTQVLVKMRTLGPATAHLVDRLKDSASSGDRLAAIAIMQIAPDKADVAWLAGRFQVEHPFIFYQAATILRNLTRDGGDEEADAAHKAAKGALQLAGSFSRPDANTLQMLRDAIRNYEARPAAADRMKDES